MKTQIATMAIRSISPALYNPRADLRPGNPEYDKLKASIETFGCVELLVWNKRTQTLISGHQRLKVLVELGYAEADVIIVDLPLEQEKALNLAMNRIQGTWDNQKLAVLLDEIIKIPDFDFSVSGFDLPEISEILDNAQEVREDGFDFDAAIETIEEPITKQGDLIELGCHRIICGDSSNFEDLARLMGEEKTHLIHTDPPYNVDYYGGNRPHANGRPKPSRHWERIYSDNLSQDEYEVWLKRIVTNVDSFLHPGASFYFWNGHRQFGFMHQMLTELGHRVSCVITWAKPNFAIGYGDYNQQTEFCLYGWKENNGAHAWYGPTNESTLWQIRRDPVHEYSHPTQKPLELAARAIRNSSERGNIVLDCFLGSGTTLIAAETLGRRCFGVEIDPKYVDGIVRRYIALVGKNKISAELRQRYLKEGQDGK